MSPHPVVHSLCKEPHFFNCSFCKWFIITHYPLVSLLCSLPFANVSDQVTCSEIAVITQQSWTKRNKHHLFLNVLQIRMFTHWVI